MGRAYYVADTQCPNVPQFTCLTPRRYEAKAFLEAAIEMMIVDCLRTGGAPSTGRGLPKKTCGTLDGTGDLPICADDAGLAQGRYVCISHAEVLVKHLIRMLPQ